MSKIVIELDPSHKLLELLGKVIKSHNTDNKGLSSNDYLLHLIEKGLEKG